MPNSYLKRHDVGYPQRPNPRGVYGIKLFEDTSLQAVEDAVNEYLLALPSQKAGWSPHLIDTEIMYYKASGPSPRPAGPDPRTRFVIKLTIYASGTITDSLT